MMSRQTMRSMAIEPVDRIDPIERRGLVDAHQIRLIRSRTRTLLITLQLTNSQKWTSRHIPI